MAKKKSFIGNARLRFREQRVRLLKPLPPQRQMRLSKLM